MADGSMSLKYFVTNHVLPANVKVLNGFGQLEEGDEVVLKSVRCVRGVEALRGRHGENLLVSFLPYEYGGLFELIVASTSQPWASYREFATVGDILKAGTPPPLAIKAKKSWRGSSESDSIYQHDILTSLRVRMDATGNSFLHAINQRGAAMCLTSNVRSDFTTDLSDIHFPVEDLVKLFESNFPVRVRLRAVPSAHRQYNTIGTVGDTFTLQRVIVRQEVAVIGNGDTFSVVADDAVDVVTIETGRSLYVNFSPAIQPAVDEEASDSDDDYVPMANTSVQEVQRILRKKFTEVRKLETHLLQQKSELQNLTETNHSLEVKLQHEQSQNVQLRARNDLLEEELQVFTEKLKTGLTANGTDETTSLKTKVMQLETERDQLESQVRDLRAQVSYQQEEHMQISELQQQNHDLNERLILVQKEKERLSAHIEEASMIDDLSHLQQTAPTTSDTDTDTPSPKPRPAAPPRQQREASRSSPTLGPRSSPTPAPRMRLSRPGPTPNTPPIPVKRSVGHTKSSPSCVKQRASSNSSPNPSQNPVTRPPPPAPPRRGPSSGIN